MQKTSNKMWDFSGVFHEKQEGRLCAQHCLNAVLQGPYFTAVELGELALRLDEEERQKMSESEKGVESEDYKKFVQQPSGNMDDTGFFSVQVISKALSLWNLELIPLNSTDAAVKEIREMPTKANAYILNMDSHWFCVRKFKCDSSTAPSNETHIFFNLNSLLSRPEYMSSLYLTEYLKQMQNEGYSIFVVCGIFPECEADLNPPKFVPNTAPPVTTIDLTRSESKSSEIDEDVQRAIKLSLAEWKEKNDRFQPNIDDIAAAGPSNGLPRSVSGSSENDADLDTALKMSMECFNGNGRELGDSSQPSAKTEVLTANQLRDKRLAYFNSLPSREK